MNIDKLELFTTALFFLAVVGCTQRPSNAELATQLDENVADFSVIVNACTHFPTIPGVLGGGPEATVQSSPELGADGVAAYNKARAAMIKLQMDRTDCVRDDQKPDHPLIEVDIAKLYVRGDEHVEQVFLYRSSPPDADWNDRIAKGYLVFLKHQGWYLSGNGLVK